MYLLSVEKLSIQLPDQRYLCRDLSFTIEPGDVLVLSGPSGSGKSSILDWLTGTMDKSLTATGDVWLGDTRLSELPTEKRRLGLMLQQDYLFPHMSVGQYLMFGLQKGDRARRIEKVRQSLVDAGLDGMGDRDPATLPGGQRARVSLVRTRLSNPCALLLDEPFSRLDSVLREQIRKFTWHAASELPVLLVTHDAHDISEGARVLTLRDAADDGDCVTGDVVAPQ